MRNNTFRLFIIDLLEFTSVRGENRIKIANANKHLYDMLYCRESNGGFSFIFSTQLKKKQQTSDETSALLH